MMITDCRINMILLFRQRLLTRALQSFVALIAKVGYGRVVSIGRPAGFRLKPPLKRLSCGYDDRQLPADSCLPGKAQEHP
jgi:hypothetical protein